MAKKKRQAGTPALQALERAQVPYVLHEYEHHEHMDGGYALDTSQVLGIDPARIFKTLMVSADSEVICALVPATGMLSLKATAKAAGAKRAQMLDPAEAEKLTGYVTGGISPLGQRTRHRVFVDSSALSQPDILVSGGKRSLSVQLTARDLAAATGAEFADLAAER